MFIKLIKESTINWKCWKWIIPSFGGIVTFLLLGKNFLDLNITNSITAYYKNYVSKKIAYL